MIVGNKLIFAFEFELIDIQKHTGNIVIWMNNKPIGFKKEEISLSGIIFQIKNKIKCDIRFPELKNLNIHELNRFFLDSKNFKLDYTLLSLGESFDDFLIRCFIIEDSIYFFSKMFSDFIYEYEKPDFSINYLKISLEDFKKINNEFESYRWR